MCNEENNLTTMTLERRKSSWFRQNYFKCFFMIILLIFNPYNYKNVFLLFLKCKSILF